MHKLKETTIFDDYHPSLSSHHSSESTTDDYHREMEATRQLQSLHGFNTVEPLELPVVIHHPEAHQQASSESARELSYSDVDITDDRDTSSLITVASFY